MVKRIIIGTIIAAVVVLIPVLSGILVGFNWEIYGWWIFVAALATPIIIDQIRLRKK